MDASLHLITVMQGVLGNLTFYGELHLFYELIMFKLFELLRVHTVQLF
jgi:hypothetical protein